MKLFNLLKKNSEMVESTESFPVILAADAKGTLISLEQIPDELFSQGVLGQGCGIMPTEGKVYAPMDGKIIQVADTLHAIGLEGIDGMEVLIHVGIDTVDMNGEGFHSYVKVGDIVNKGQLLLTMDLEKIKEAGHPTTVITIVTNSDDFSVVETVSSGEIDPEKDMLRVSK